MTGAFEAVDGGGDAARGQTGGTGGLALAHGLKRAGISFAGYEREETRSSDLHGYRVGINPDGSRALEYRGSETQPHPRPRRQRRPRQQGEVWEAIDAYKEKMVRYGF
ncbi:hypothetical protein [Streptomyces chrestomyceticus]|uniref:hypothetical protein n=1 Tax=Streptomyces chrestomyceticus TaxID=68185 RepID=UPI0033E7C00F